MSKPWYIFTSDHSGLAIATHLQDEGEDVTLVLIHPTRKKDKLELPKTDKEKKEVRESVAYLSKNGNGLIKKMWANDAMAKIKKGDYVLFDQIWGFTYGDALYKRGVKVLGGSKIGYTLESERKQTLKLLESMGYALPFQKDFGPNSSDKAIKFLESVNNEMLFVLKSDNGSVTTCVADYNNEELIQKLTAEKAEIDSDGLVLQEKKLGIEYNIESYYCNGSPIFCNIDLEEKRKFNNTSKQQIGCSYDLVWTLPLDHQLRERINKPFDKFAAKYIGIGMLDLSVIHVPKENKDYALEVCGVRFGYNQIYSLLNLLNIPIAEFFRSLLDGNYKGDIASKIFKPEFSASLRLLNNGAKSNSPIMYPKELRNKYWIWDNYMKGGKLYTTGGEEGEQVGIITDNADTPEGAFAKVRELYNKFYLSTLWARDDYQDDETITLPLARYHELRRLKLIE